MPTKTRMNVYFEPALLKQVEALALRRNVSKSAVIEAAVASFLSEDSAERLEAVFAPRMDPLGPPNHCLCQGLPHPRGKNLLFLPVLPAHPAAISRQAAASPAAHGAR